MHVRLCSTVLIRAGREDLVELAVSHLKHTIGVLDTGTVGNITSDGTGINRYNPNKVGVWAWVAGIEKSVIVDVYYCGIHLGCLPDLTDECKNVVIELAKERASRGS